jgi:hypothetical protein
MVRKYSLGNLWMRGSWSYFLQEMKIDDRSEERGRIYKVRRDLGKHPHRDNSMYKSSRVENII